MGVNKIINLPLNTSIGIVNVPFCPNTNITIDREILWPENHRSRVTAPAPTTLKRDSNVKDVPCIFNMTPEDTHWGPEGSVTRPHLYMYTVDLSLYASLNWDLVIFVYASVLFGFTSVLSLLLEVRVRDYIWFIRTLDPRF